MGLSVSVGFLAFLLEEGDAEETSWFRQELAAINAALADSGLQAHVEPEALPPVEFHGLHEFSYSSLHYLRRAVAYQDADRPIPGGDLTAEHDAFIADRSSTLDSHLLCHSDAEGYYVPRDFAEPIFHEGLSGGILGSSFALIRELAEVAPALGIPLVAGVASEATLEALAAIEDDEPHYREKCVWLALWETCQASVEHGTLIVFS